MTPHTVSVCDRDGGSERGMCEWRLIVPPSLPVNGPEWDKELLCLYGNQRGEMGAGQHGGRGVKTQKLGRSKLLVIRNHLFY